MTIYELFSSPIYLNFSSVKTIHVCVFSVCVGSFHLQQVSIFHPSGVHIQDTSAACDV